MTKYQLEELLDLLDSSRERLLVAIEPLPDQALLFKGAVDTWTIADVLSNITVWEAEMVTGLLHIDQNKRPDNLLNALKEPKVFDQQCYDENRGRDLDAIFADFQQVRVQLEEWLEHFSERVLNNPKRYKWFNGRSLAEIIAITTFKREAEFIPDIERFAHAWETGTLFPGLVNGSGNGTQINVDLSD